MIVRFLGYAFCTVFIGFGLVMSLQTLYAIVHGRAVVKWPTVPATMESCDLEDWSEEGSTTYRIKAVYTFSVHGVSYTATGIHPAIESGGEELQTLYAKLKEAKVVQARYNPAHPAEAYLIAGSFSKHWGAFFGCLLMFTFGSLFLLAMHCVLSARTDYVARLEVVK